MDTPAVRPTPKGVRFMLIAWLLIAAKCASVAWAVAHWNAPIAAGWVIGPTVAMGLLATALWWTRGRA